MPLSEKAKQNKKKYNASYIKENMKRIPLTVQNSQYEEIKSAAESVDESINGFIKKAINTRIESLKNTPGIKNE